jgi:predicted RND superfamily exporter protein
MSAEPYRRTSRLADILYRFRFVLSALVVLGAAAFAPSANITNIDNDLSAWISRDDPAYQDYERFRKEFGGTRNLIIALEGDRLFTLQGLAYIDRITREIEKLDRVERVQSLATANSVRPLPATADDEGGLEVAPLMDVPLDSEAEAAEVRRAALEDPLMRGDLVSEDGRVTAVFVSFDEDRIDEVRGQVIEGVRGVVERDMPAGLEAYYNGSLEISETYNRVTLSNTRELTPPILIITILAIYVLFRSVRKTGVILVAIGVSVLWTLGLYAAAGFSFNVLTSMLAPLVIVLAIADDVHIVQHFDHELRLSGSKERAFKSSVAHLFTPLLGASGTTALGMLSLATSEVVAVRTFGIGAAIGIMVDFVISLVFVPTLLTLVRPDLKATPQERWLSTPLQRVGRFAFERPAWIVSIVLGLSIVAGLGIVKLRVDTNHINFFPASHPLSRSAALVDRELSGIYSFNILIEGPPESIATPDTLGRMDRLSRDLSGLPYVRKVTSLADYVKRVNQQLSAGSQQAYALPSSKEAIAQELFVFGLSDQGRTELSRVVASDFSRAHISVKLASMSSDLVFEQIRIAEELSAKAFAGSGLTITVTGSGRLFATLDHYLVVSQLSSFGTAFLTVFAVIFVVFRSASFGLLGIIANAFPVVVVMGVMGWLGISLNIATVMVASIALGIVDDDTIHFIGRYRREIANGAGTLDAVETASMHEGRAALTTTLINALSYSVMMLSEYRPSAWFGSLLATTMALAFVTEVLLVPATIALLPRLLGAPALARRLGTAA